MLASIGNIGQDGPMIWLIIRQRPVGFLQVIRKQPTCYQGMQKFIRNWLQTQTESLPVLTLTDKGNCTYTLVHITCFLCPTTYCMSAMLKTRAGCHLEDSKVLATSPPSEVQHLQREEGAQIQEEVYREAVSPNPLIQQVESNCELLLNFSH